LSAVLDVRTQAAGTVVPPPLRLLPLNGAVEVILTAGTGANDRQARLRRLQALRKLATMGLANPTYRKALIERPHTDDETALRIQEAGKVVDLLAARVWEEFKLKLALKGFTIMAPAEANAYLDEGLSLLDACAPVATTCVACCSPWGGVGYNKTVTTVTAGCYVKRDLNCLAKAFDPRSWEACASAAFTKSQRVTYSEETEQYTDVPTQTGDIGNPWSGLLEEQVTVGGDANFQNWLEIKFEITPKVRVDYKKFDSGLYSIPALFIDRQTGSVLVDEGYLLAEDSTNALYPATDNWKRIELVKTVRFVDLTDLGPNPWNIDLGEILNYWAPALLSEWLESGTQGAVCCDNCPAE
jgi:hypothetical protein